MHTTTPLAVPTQQLTALGLQLNQPCHYQLTPSQLIQQTVALNQGTLNNTGALVIKTGTFTGRSPKDKYTVKDAITAETVNWNDFNIAIEETYFTQLKTKMLAYLSSKPTWVRDCCACANTDYRLRLRVINENPYSNLFAYNMFIRPTNTELENFTPHWHVIQAPGFKANPAVDGVRAENFAIISFTHKTILIGGTGYTGEIKKGIFTMLNFVLPTKANVLSMHCSANVGANNDTALFFGLSGTGKTTLSADAQRNLIGDDEHGWGDNGIFNFEGGCYAKTIDLNAEKEPEIFNAIKDGALVENTTFLPNTNIIDFASKAITENTRVSYPLHFITNALEPSVGNVPKNIFFLTCDAYGVLPPISKLTAAQAMYQFISGYTAKIAGTEAGITEPKSTFSACFGAPFMPLHPATYAKMLGQKLQQSGATVWLINTGWSGGPYGIGKRMQLPYTRAMITAALNGELDNVTYDTTPWFKLAIPTSCPNVPSQILNARNTWANPTDFDTMAKNLANQFVQNFAQYAAATSQDILDAAPRVS
jgi:phosphoenolpyruvate carboxykinase (ATP)